MKKKPWLVLAGIVAALLSLALLVAACNGNGAEKEHEEEPTATESADQTSAGETTVDVSLDDFAVNLSEATVAAGAVTFNVTNNGTSVPHNLLVVKTDLDADALPVDDAAFMVDEDQVDIAVASEDLDIGAAEEVAADLEPGSYVLICNIPTHYGLGMTTAFTVE